MTKKVLKLFAPALIIASLPACGFSPGDPMSAAESAFAENDYRSARVHLMNALKDDPSDAGANFLYAQTLLRLGDGNGAENALNKLAGKAEYADELPALWAQAMYLRELPEKAIEWAEKAKANRPLAAWVRVQALGDLGREDEAIAALNSALSEFPKDPALLALRGNIQIARRELTAAQASAQAALAADPDHIDALLLAGQLRLMQSDIAGAKAHFAKAHENYPGSIVPLFSLAAAEADLGDMKAARAHLDEILELAPGHPMAIFLTAKMAFNDGDLGKAHALMQEAEKDLAEVPGALLLSGEIAHLRGNQEQAIGRLRRFLSMMPGHVHGTTVLAQSLAAVGSDAEAYALVAPVADRATATPQLLSLAAKLARKTGQSPDRFAARAKTGVRNDIGEQMTLADKAIKAKNWTKAENIYADLRASGLDNNAIIMNNSALVALERGKGAQAVEFARAAVALTPGDPHVLDTLGWVLLKSGTDKVEALSLLRQASAQLPANLEIRWHYANALAANGQTAEAKKIISGLKQFAGAEQRQQIDRLLTQL